MCRNTWMPQTRFVKAPLILNALARAGGLDADLAKAPEDLRAPTASAACTSCAKGKWSAEELLLRSSLARVARTAVE